MTRDELLLLVAVGLAFVLRNWWDLIRYGLARGMMAAPVAIDPARALAVPFPRIGRQPLLESVRRPSPRRRSASRSGRPGQRAVKAHPG